jgi:hypothetical protein
MLLETKNAIVYGAAGSMGSAVVRAFAREGATVFLAGRTLAKLDKVADEIRRAGGAAETAHVDAMDPAAVEAHVAGVAKTAGSVDISFNAISYSVVQNIPQGRQGGRDQVELCSGNRRHDRRGCSYQREGHVAGAAPAAGRGGRHGRVPGISRGRRDDRRDRQPQLRGHHRLKTAPGPEPGSSASGRQNLARTPSAISSGLTSISASPQMRSK